MAKVSFDKSIIELEKILAEIQDPATGIDILSTKISKAKELIQSCKTQLRTIERDVNDIFED